MHITITGKLGSGKSTVAKKLVELYGFEIFSTGAILRAAAAERVMKDPRPGEPAEDIDELCAELVERSKVEQSRFMQLYGVDYYDYNNYNLVVDSSRRTPDEIVALIWEGFNAYMADPAGYGHKEML